MGLFSPSAGSNQELLYRLLALVDIADPEKVGVLFQ